MRHLVIALQTFLHQLVTLLQRRDGVPGLLLDAGDHPGNFIRGLAGSCGQAAHFVRHHRKAAALLTGAGSLDGRIQRQQVGLFGDGSDDADDAADFLRACPQAVHHRGRTAEGIGDLLQRTRCFIHGAAADAGLLGIVTRHALGARHVVGDVHRGGAELLHRTGHAGDFTGLLLHALAGPGRQARQRFGARADLLGRTANVLDHA